MFPQGPLLFPDQIIIDAQGSLENCRSELLALMDRAREQYDLALAELNRLIPDPIERRVQADPSAQVEGLLRSSQLKSAAEQLDSLLTRLASSAGHLEHAAAALEGRASRLAGGSEKLETNLEAAAIQAQEEERYRLAREIHDGPAQILANVALQLEYISKLATRDPARAKDEMETIQTDLRLAVGEVRRFMYDLRPPALEQQGVGPAVESHCQRLSQRFGLEIEVQWRSNSLLGGSAETAVFRIVQEALQNVVKHAQATRAVVEAADKNGLLEVAVSDNGKGFDPTRAHQFDPKHFGLAGMRARVHQIGGTMEVSSSPGQGTTVLFRVPLA